MVNNGFVPSLPTITQQTQRDVLLEEIDILLHEAERLLEEINSMINSFDSPSSGESKNDKT